MRDYMSIYSFFRRMFFFVILSFVIYMPTIFIRLHNKYIISIKNDLFLLVSKARGYYCERGEAFCVKIKLREYREQHRKKRRERQNLLRF